MRLFSLILHIFAMVVMIYSAVTGVDFWNRAIIAECIAIYFNTAKGE